MNPDRELVDEYRGCKIYVAPDLDQANPREWDNLGRMICFHRRYDLGDKKDGYHETNADVFQSYISGTLIQDFPGDYDPPDNCPPEVAVALPLCLYDHSGITMNCEGYSHIDPVGWDWGQVGYIYVTRETILKNWGRKRLSKTLLKKVEEILRCEVQAYASYLEGDAFGWMTEDEDGNPIDSCWGYLDYHQDNSWKGDAIASINFYRTVNFQQLDLPAPAGRQEA